MGVKVKPDGQAAADGLTSSDDGTLTIDSSNATTVNTGPTGARRRSTGIRASLRASFSRNEERVDIPAEWDGPGVFGNLQDMKSQVRKHLFKPAYDVKDFYHTEGFWQQIARHQLFENITLAIIAVNAMWMAIDTDFNKAETLLQAHPVFQVAEHLFCVYFTGEWFTRFMAFKRKLDGRRDGWFVFDSALVFMMVMETWVVTVIMLTAGGSSGGSPMGNASILRLFRLLRLSRMARMLKSMPELLILIKGMAAAMRSVFFVMLLLIILMYIFAIAFKQLMDGTEAGEMYFDKMLDSMYTLLVSGTFLDNLTIVTTNIGRDSMVCAFLFFVFVLLAALTIMNMLIGVLCEVVSKVAETEQEDISLTFAKSKMKEVVKHIDFDGDLQISRAEFGSIMTNPIATDALREVGVDPEGLLDFIDQIFESEDNDEDERDLSFDDFMEVILSFRGSNKATVKDMVDLRKWFTVMIENQLRRLQEGRLKSRTFSSKRSTSSNVGSTSLSLSSAVDTSGGLNVPCGDDSFGLGGSIPLRPGVRQATPADDQHPVSVLLNRQLRDQTARLEAFLIAACTQVQSLESAPMSQKLISPCPGPDGRFSPTRATSKTPLTDYQARADRAREFSAFALAEVLQIRELIKQAHQQPHLQLRRLLDKFEGFISRDAGVILQAFLDNSQSQPKQHSIFDNPAGPSTPSSESSDSVCGCAKSFEELAVWLDELQDIRDSIPE